MNSEYTKLEVEEVEKKVQPKILKLLKDYNLHPLDIYEQVEAGLDIASRLDDPETC